MKAMTRSTDSKRIAESYPPSHSEGLRRIWPDPSEHLRATASGIWTACRSAASRLAAFFVAACTALAAVAPTLAVTPESPEVLAVIDKGLAYLDKQTQSDVGGKCLIALAFHKRGVSDNHVRIAEAVQACKEMVEAERAQNYDYGKCLAIIFLSEMNSAAHRELINTYVKQLNEHQKPHGGFGYLSEPVGDTSQTQYAALAYWEMMNHGISPEADAVQRCLGWIMRTRDPSGVWAYKGVDPGGGSLVKQSESPGVSMAAAGMCASMLLGNSLGLLKPNQTEDLLAIKQEDLPPALRKEEVKKKVRAPDLPSGDVSPQQLAETLKAGRAWYEKNFTLEWPEYQSYYLYSIERYHSFEEFLGGRRVESPDWYNAGFEKLKRTQAEDGSWNDRAGAPAATAFSILFLLRSTQQSIDASLGEGTLVGGRGLPRDLSKVQLRGGKLVVEQNRTEVDELLGMLDDSKSESLEALLDSPAALQVTNVGPEQARRLQQVVRSGPAGARLLAVGALSELRKIDHAPTLIFALTDPDKRVVRRARDGLRSISRSFEGFGPPDNFEEPERVAAIERWKAWYRAVRPDAAALP